MNGKYLLMEYRESAMSAYINRNNYDDGLLEKTLMEIDPSEAYRELESLKKLLLNPKVDCSEARHRQKIIALKQDVLDRDNIIMKLRKQVMHKGQEIHSSVIPCGSMQPRYGERRTTIDNNFLTCKKCVQLANQHKPLDCGAPLEVL